MMIPLPKICIKTHLHYVRKILSVIFNKNKIFFTFTESLSLKIQHFSVLARKKKKKQMMQGPGTQATKLISCHFYIPGECDRVCA